MSFLPRFVKAAFLLVPGAGVEPARNFFRGILSPLCLPISPSGQVSALYGAQGGSRTLTPLGHWNLNPACLPVPTPGPRGAHSKWDVASAQYWRSHPFQLCIGIGRVTNIETFDLIDYVFA